MTQDCLNGQIVNAKPVQVGRETASECVPAPPGWRHVVAFVLVAVGSVLLFRFAAMSAHIKSRENLATQDAVRVSGIPRPVRKHRAGNRIVLGLAMRG